jgi:cyclomaltodextrinase / maltogenic alpha-amylase / neopullulanase
MVRARRRHDAWVYFWVILSEGVDETMPDQLSLNIDDLVVYRVNPENYPEKDVFSKIQEDLARIKKLNIDLLWLMPFQLAKTDSGQPDQEDVVAVLDFFLVNPEYGNKTDLYKLINTAHELDIKIMMETILCPISKDSPLVNEHPEWFCPPSKINPDLPGSTDSCLFCYLDFSNESIPAYFVEIFQGWAAFGIDAFHYQLESYIPMDFWDKTRFEVERIKPGVLWMEGDQAFKVQK